MLTDPTMGGVSASLAMLGDINVGGTQGADRLCRPRVIEQTVREKLPEGFQRSEFLLLEKVPSISSSTGAKCVTVWPVCWPKMMNTQVIED